LAVFRISSVPTLRRLCRRFRTPWASAVAVVVFTAHFSLSAFVIGPAVSGTDDDPQPPAPTVAGPTDPTPSLTGDDHGHRELHEQCSKPVDINLA